MSKRINKRQYFHSIGPDPHLYSHLVVVKYAGPAPWSAPTYKQFLKGITAELSKAP